MHGLAAGKTFLVEAEKWIMGEVGQVDCFAISERVIGGHDHGQRCGAEGLREEILFHFARGGSGEREIDLSAAKGGDLFSGMHLENLDAHFGVLAVKVF